MASGESWGATWLERHAERWPLRSGVKPGLAKPESGCCKKLAVSVGFFCA